MVNVQKPVTIGMTKETHLALNLLKYKLKMKTLGDVIVFLMDKYKAEV